jgi:hypothetical protein
MFLDKYITIVSRRLVPTLIPSSSSTDSFDFLFILFSDWRLFAPQTHDSPAPPPQQSVAATTRLFGVATTIKPTGDEPTVITR